MKTIKDILNIESEVSSGKCDGCGIVSVTYLKCGNTDWILMSPKMAYCPSCGAEPEVLLK